VQNVKQLIFLYLTSRQKAQLLSYLKSHFKKFSKMTGNELIERFFEDEKYYLDINNPHFEFIKDYFDNDDFRHDLEKFFDFCFWEKEQKEKLKLILDKQKEIQKEIRKKASDFKMSKLKPTKKQLSYYDKICKNHGVEKKDLKEATRLDLRNWIMELINEYN